MENKDKKNEKKFDDLPHLISTPDEFQYFMAQKIYRVEELGILLKRVGVEKDMERLIGFIPVFRGELTAGKYAPSIQQIQVQMNAPKLSNLGLKN